MLFHVFFTKFHIDFMLISCFFHAHFMFFSQNFTLISCSFHVFFTKFHTHFMLISCFFHAIFAVLGAILNKNAVFWQKSAVKMNVSCILCHWCWQVIWGAIVRQRSSSIGWASIP